jgi:hypothetical protein
MKTWLANWVSKPLSMLDVPDRILFFQFLVVVLVTLLIII